MFKRTAGQEWVTAARDMRDMGKMVIPVIPVISVEAPEAAATGLARTMGAESTLDAYIAARATFRAIAPMPTYRTWVDEARIGNKTYTVSQVGKAVSLALMGR